MTIFPNFSPQIHIIIFVCLTGLNSGTRGDSKRQGESEYPARHTKTRKVFIEDDEDLNVVVVQQMPRVKKLQITALPLLDPKIPIYVASILHALQILWNGQRNARAVTSKRVTVDSKVSYVCAESMCCATVVLVGFDPGAAIEKRDRHFKHEHKKQVN
jgi:hypothetical protein